MEIWKVVTGVDDLRAMVEDGYNAKEMRRENTYPKLCDPEDHKLRGAGEKLREKVIADVG